MAVEVHEAQSLACSLTASKDRKRRDKAQECGCSPVAAVASSSCHWAEPVSEDKLCWVSVWSGDLLQSDRDTSREVMPDGRGEVAEPVILLSSPLSAVEDKQEV